LEYPLLCGAISYFFIDVISHIFNLSDHVAVILLIGAISSYYGILMLQGTKQSRQNSDIKKENWTFYTLHCTKDFMDEVDNMAARENITRGDIIRRAVGLYHIAQSEEAKGNVLSFVNKETNNIEESIKL
jgi:hypothetical protein